MGNRKVGASPAVATSYQEVVAVNPITGRHEARTSAASYETVAASQTNQAIGATGATGDYLSHVVIVPATTSPGVVTIKDDTTAIVSFPGGASSLTGLSPITVPIMAVSLNGAWKITTGANVSVLAVGNFT